MKNEIIKNEVETTTFRDEILDEVKRTRVLRARHLSEATIKSIYHTSEDYWEGNLDDYLTEKHLIAYLKLTLENSKESPNEDLEIINLVYEPPVESLQINDGNVELFADRTMLLHSKEELFGIINPVLLYFSLNDYVSRNIEIFTAAHDKQYLEPKTLTEADRNEILLASLSCFKFEYEGDLRTIRSIEDEYQGRNFLRTLALKRPKPTSEKIVRAAIGKLDMMNFSNFGAAIIENIAVQKQCTDPSNFLQTQSALYLLERKFFGFLKEPEVAGEIESLKNDLLKIQAFKEPSSSIDQIIFPDAEVLIFSDRSVLYAPEGGEPESHLDIYQFIMLRLRDLQSVYFSYDRDRWESDPDAISSQFSKYGLSFSYSNGRVITKFSRKFKDKLFSAANVRLV